MLKKLKNLARGAIGKNKEEPEAHAPAFDPDEISPHAIRVIEDLVDEGYEAYLVGGGVRDLLLGLHPKDFDVATDATPEQVRQVFRRSRIVGRRFRIAHVMFGREVIEVTTFRGHHPGKQDKGKKNKHAVTSDSGRLLRDNIYGSLEDDALRRDFTVNALYYDPINNEVLDFCNGLEDLEKRQLVLIGDAETRYREDPVRMLRAIRFSAKLDFNIHSRTLKPIKPLNTLLQDIPAARMFDEVLKLFMAGAALITYQKLQEHSLFGELFPATQRVIHQGDETTVAFLEKMLRNTDDRIHHNKPVTPAFLYGALLWPAVRQQREALLKQGMPPVQALQQAGIGAIEHQQHHTSIPRRFSTPMREIWDLQLRLESPRGGKRATQLLTHPRFRAAYDFLLLREQAREETSGMAEWWTAFQRANEAEQAALLQKLGPANSGRKRPRRRRRNNSGRNNPQRANQNPPAP